MKRGCGFGKKERFFGTIQRNGGGRKPFLGRRIETGGGGAEEARRIGDGREEDKEERATRGDGGTGFPFSASKKRSNVAVCREYFVLLWSNS